MKWFTLTVIVNQNVTLANLLDFCRLLLRCFKVRSLTNARRRVPIKLDSALMAGYWRNGYEIVICKKYIQNLGHCPMCIDLSSKFTSVHSIFAPMQSLRPYRPRFCKQSTILRVILVPMIDPLLSCSKQWPRLNAGIRRCVRRFENCVSIWARTLN